jgi:hypothetical protein
MNGSLFMVITAGSWVMLATGATAAADLRVGAAAVELQADDSMPIAGGIHAGRAQGQEGKLRATAVVLEKPGAATLAIVSCDVLMLTRDLVDPAVAEIEKTCKIPAANVLVHATHTHHAPSTIRIHGYGRAELFCDRLKAAIVEAVAAAQGKLADSTLYFKRGEERTVGMNSRLLLKDGTIFWVGPRDDAVRPTGPFDPDLPVLAFRTPAGTLQALLYGHSTHSIGTLKPGVRSPSFYGLVAQELEQELGGTAAFLEGASGSTHALNCTAEEAFRRIKQAVTATLAEAQPQKAERLAALRRPFTFKVRTFDEAAEEEAVTQYCNKRIGPGAEGVAVVFRQMRKELAPLQGQERTTWIQAMAVGEVAIAAVPAELFTKLGMDIKRRSPYKQTVVVELANDWIGYLPDAEAYKLGGYQVWTGLHSYAEPGTGERIVDQTVKLLEELATARPARQ